MNKKIIKKVFFYVTLGLILFFFIFPIYWAVATSIKPKILIFNMPPSWLFVPTLNNYKRMFARGDFLSYVVNSLIVTLGSTSLSLCIGTLAAYSFSRFNFKWAKSLFLYIFSVRFVPAMAVLLPFYLLFTTLKLHNTYQGLILIYLTFQIPFVVWVMYSFFNEIPRELDEAARIDGCSHLRTFLAVILPVSLPGIVAVSIVCFISAWNELLFAVILTKSEIQTVPVGISSFMVLSRGVMWGEIMAAATVAMIPAMIFIFIVQKQLVRGLTFGIKK